MNHKFYILLGTSAVSVFSFLAIDKAASGPKQADSDQPAKLPHNARLAGGRISSKPDAQDADLAITARIREGITVRKNLSANARNVKIITRGGRVVLTGAVITAEEKRLIGDIAIGVQRRENVDNQLVVRTPPSAPTALRVVR